MKTWKRRGIELLVLAGQRQLTAEERAELIEHCRKATR